MTAPPTNGNREIPFVVRLDSFSGPLDLLLHLIREQEVDIYDIPIAAIADQFLEVIDELGLNGAADYLEMAAQLLRIKIQMLLPRPFDEEGWEDPRAELVRRLLEYEQVREVADWLAQRSGDQASRFPRGWFAEPPDAPPRPIAVTLEELLVSVEELIESLPEPMLHRVVPRPLDVEGATRRIEALLEEREQLTLLEAIGTATSVADVLSVLIAVLELARVGRIRLAQRKPFGSVTIRREPDRTAV
ncbi:MAG: segregation/condensation protein A [Gemmatimonadota bacterium]|nr:MAG: segregation/condensation protein A [Gemmatimonadota bacterium]